MSLDRSERRPRSSRHPAQRTGQRSRCLNRLRQRGRLGFGHPRVHHELDNAGSHRPRLVHRALSDGSIDPQRCTNCKDGGVTDEAARDDHGRRRLTDEERGELLDLPLTAVWSTLTSTGRIHSVPVHFRHVSGELHVMTETHSVKCRNAVRVGRATLCVETTLNGTDRRYAMAEGPVRVEGPVSGNALIELAQRYGGQEPDPSDERTFANSTILVLTPEHWIAWSDAD